MLKSRRVLLKSLIYGTGSFLFFTSSKIAKSEDAEFVVFVPANSELASSDELDNRKLCCGSRTFRLANELENIRSVIKTRNISLASVPSSVLSEALQTGACRAILVVTNPSFTRSDAKEFLESRSGMELDWFDFE